MTLSYGVPRAFVKIAQHALVHLEERRADGFAGGGDT